MAESAGKMPATINSRLPSYPCNMPYGRLSILDALRGTAIVLMLIQHSIYFLYYDINGLVYGEAYLASRLSAPLFLTIVGYCIALSAERRIPLTGRRGFMKHILVRAALLVITASALNILRFDGIGTLNIIHLITASILVTSVVRVFESRAAYAAALAGLLALSVAPSLTGGWEAVNSWLPGWYSMAEGYAMGPWQFYGVLGLGLRWLLSGRKIPESHILPLAEILLLFGLISLGLRMGVGISENRLPYTLMLLAGMTAAYYVISAINEIKGMGRLMSVLTAYGRHSLALYLTHQILFITAPKLLGIGNAFGEAGTAAALLGFLLAAYAGTRIYEARRTAPPSRL